ncbi:glycoside hydrolase [Lindgomyces ingoldianus]|uniref:Glycoside hydrolase n=1 Tax=Lindgomyces ingoldianus TaxID=673940 RepID=A0ACB6Q9T8_9PLEO|nr:glycoside hydrolase [Lindgomyces ingoldianus]KAF2463667.1 glycoside hydrolase [Lindgomyces ingoldianus]
MRFLATMLSSAAALSTVNAALLGFCYSAFFHDETPKHQVDFEYEFNAAKQLPNTNGQFSSARLYSMVQWSTTDGIIEAIPAAINTQTTLFLGIWASAGDQAFAYQIAALQGAIQQYGTAFTDLVVAIAVGSEDLYRLTPIAIGNNDGPGASPDTLVSYIQQTRAAIRNTALAGKPVGHVDTWTAYVNTSNKPVIEAVDFIGVDTYPYFQKTMMNSVGNSNQTFYDAYDATVKAAMGKPVWVSETGWPVSGPQMNLAVASVENAQIYWQDVTCSLISKGINLYYYTLQDAQYGSPAVSFGIKPAVGDLQNLQPLFDLSCLNSPINPDKVVGNNYVARISPRESTLFNFDIPPEHSGKTCNVIFILPKDTKEWWSGYRMWAPGGISVFQLQNPAQDTTSANKVGNVKLIGTINQLNLGSGKVIRSAPCEAGKKVGYQVDSVGGLDLQYFQTKEPAIGLWVTVS